MSLIVAKKMNDSIIFVSDTLEWNLLSQQAEHVLNAQIKTTIINKVFALSFAGNPYFSYLAIEEINNLVNKDCESILEVLKASNIISQMSTDYILADSGEFNLYKIANGEIENCNSVWIGNYDAFNLFQQEYHSLSADLDIHVRMSMAFQKVIDSEQDNCKDVGGFKVIVKTIREQFYFRYMFSKTIISRATIENLPAGWHPIPLGDATNGSYDLELFRLFNINDESLALFIKTGSLGLVWKAGTFLKPEKIIDSLRVEFVKLIKEDYSLENELSLSWQECFEAGFKWRNLDDHVSAYYFFNQGITLTDELGFITDQEQFYKIYSERGMALLKLEHFIDAISDFKKAIEYNPHYFYAHYNLAAVYDYLDRTEEASMVREEMLAIFGRIS